MTNYPVECFQTLGPNLIIILQNLLKDDEICKLLYYMDRDALSRSNLSADQKDSLIEKNIMLAPRVPENNDIKGCKILLRYDNFIPNYENPNYSNANLSVHVLATPDEWVLDGNTLRVFALMGRIHSILQGLKLKGLNSLRFVESTHYILTPYYTGYMLRYTSFETTGKSDKESVFSFD